MSVRVLFFGSIAERQGVRESRVAIDDADSLGALLSHVGCEELSPMLLAVNRQQVSDRTLPLTSGDEVAIMPPFSGG